MDENVVEHARGLHVETGSGRAGSISARRAGGCGRPVVEAGRHRRPLNRRDDVIPRVQSDGSDIDSRDLIQSWGSLLS